MTPQFQIPNAETLTRRSTVIVRTAFVAIALAVSASGFSDEPEVQARKGPIFEGDVQAILKSHCFKCHGFESRKANLDLRTRRLMLHGGDRGPVLVPGDAEGSLLVKQISSRTMPPKGELPLTDSQIDTVRRWIETGAAVSQPDRGYSATEARAVTPKERVFWAFQRLRRPRLPKVQHTELVESPVDSFMLARLEEKGLVLSPPAVRVVQLRRANFDLIGLPPSPAEVHEFLQDTTPSAYERLLDRLLASPHFGERWGRHWLDAAGYAEVRGTDYDQNLDRKSKDYAPGMWRYRQYVIDSLNEDKPYGRFLVEQLAGDELVDWQSMEQLSREARELLVATSFLRTAPDLTWDPSDNTVITRFGVLNQTVETVVQNVLGLTLKCARCHTHKFDPIPQRDYYRMLAIFTPAMDPHGWLIPHDRDVQREGDVIHAFYDVGPPPPTWFLRRGDHATPGPKVEPGFLSVLCKTDADALKVEAKPAGDTTGRRLALARWLTNSDGRAGALAARVRVSRVWQQLFGTGLVKTSDNFGVQGEHPTHPDILEWLAVEFVSNDWKLKPLLKTIMMSSVYRQTSTPQVAQSRFSLREWASFRGAKSDSDASADPLRVDPDNQLLWRMRVRRLSSEAIRDSMLATSGVLDRTMGGPPVNTDVLADGRVIVPDKGQETPTSHWRRSVYTLARRNFSPTLMSVFDQPRMVAACMQRERSTVVLQSLALLNDEFVLEQADWFAARVLREAGDGPEARIERTFRLALAREPTPNEVRSCLRLLRQQDARFRENGANEEEVPRKALACLCQVVFNTSEFLYVE